MVAPTYTPYTDTNIPTATEMRSRWCLGLPLTDAQGNQLQDIDITEYVMDAVKQTERKLDIFLKPTIVYCNAKSRGLVKGTDYDIDAPAHDYDSKAWFNYGFLQLRHRPVIDLFEFKLVLPNNQVVVDLLANATWVKLKGLNGQVELVPYAGDPTLFALAGTTLSGYPFITGAIQGQIPQMIYASYVAGYDIGEIPTDIRTIVAKQAAVTLLGVAGDALVAGVTNTSTSLDGLSESVTYTVSAKSTLYQARIDMYKQDIKDFFDPKEGSAKEYEHGITMV